MSRRKNKDPGAEPQLHPTRSFEQYVADATLAKLSGYINSELQRAAQAILMNQQQAMQTLLTRLVALEELAVEKLSVTKDDLAARVADIQDRFEGFNTINDGTVETNDRVRLEIQTKTAEQTEYQPSSRLLIDNVGSGRTLGKELESALIGMRTGETREVLLEKNNNVQVSMSVNKISRQPTKESTPEDTTVLNDAQRKEVPDVSANAG